MLLPAYARAMQSTVLTSGRLLRTCYATSGTDLGYAATRPASQRARNDHVRAGPVQARQP
eukprot:3082172-Rhodomonas_salina.1